MTAPFKLISRQEALAITGLPESTMALLIKRGQMPAPQPLNSGGRRKFWHPDVFYGWLERQLPDTSAPAATATSSTLESSLRTPRRRRTGSGVAPDAQTRHARRIAELNRID